MRAGQLAALLPPTADYSTWQPDLRPTARHRICWYADTRPRIRGVRLPRGLVPPGTRLTLVLASPDPTSPGLYLLTPTNTLP